jgi:hypothetical protein
MNIDKIIFSVLEASILCEGIKDCRIIDVICCVVGKDNPFWSTKFPRRKQYGSCRSREEKSIPALQTRSLIRSSRPTQIFQPPQQGFFSVHAQLQLLGNIFQLSVLSTAVNVRNKN